MKQVTIPDIGEVQLVRHANAKSLRISITGNSQIKVTLPSWVPYRAGIAFVQSKKAWISENITTKTELKNGQAIGKFHHLYFKSSQENSNVTTRKKGSELWVVYPTTHSANSSPVQDAAQRIAKKALRDQAENLLPKRLSTLAQKFDFEYKSISIRQLKARWGSCNSKNEITLNFFLMQLPWDLIDYVLLHELSHTKALHHGPEFWSIFETALPGAKQRRKLLKNYSPNL
jgi:predicted metal-dependent hydrolase